MKKMVVAALAAAIASASATPALADTPPPLPTVPGVPVLGQAWVGNTVDARLAVLTIHGVRRTEGATILAAGTSGTVTVTGHTDSTASDAYNLDLSNRRAAAVASALAPRIPPGLTITAVGKGESEPIADNGTPEGRALNRRVTITLPQ